MAAAKTLRTSALFLGLLLGLLLPGPGRADPLRVDQWDRKLTGTYWYVPTAGLPATFHSATIARPFNIEQQTVYYIESCVRGVINGWLVNQWSGGSVPLTLACSNMTGTVDPKGSIAIIFSTNGGYSTTSWPKATVMYKAGKLRTLVQASIPIDANNFVVHGPTWMTVITPKDKEWADLPGNPGSLPSFVAQCGHVV